MGPPRRPVVVIDDNAETNQAIAALLRVQGYHTRSFQDARAALDYLLVGGEASLILLDLVMPHMDGWAFRVEQTRDPVLSRIPVIVYSAHSGGGLPDVVAYVRKSADPEVLLDLVAGTCLPD